MYYKIKTTYSFCKDGVTMPFYFFADLGVHGCRLGESLGGSFF